MTESADRLYKRASSEMMKKQWLAAIKLLQHELAVVQKNWRLSWNLGWCYFKLDKFDDARKHMIRASRLAPRKPDLQMGSGERLSQEKTFQESGRTERRMAAVKTLCRGVACL